LELSSAYIKEESEPEHEAEKISYDFQTEPDLAKETERLQETESI
jgi:hypothetical protein